MKSYDYIFVGGGVSALATARELAFRTEGLRIAMVDPDGRDDADRRTFGYWYEGDSLVPDGFARRWNRWTVVSDYDTVIVELGSWSYETFDVRDWRRAIIAELEGHASVDWLDTRAKFLGWGGDGRMQVSLEEGGVIEAPWILDSRPPDRFDTDQPVLFQSFRGWRVETEQPTFDPAVMCLMGFGESRDDAVQFAYVVPETERLAFVESVVIESSGEVDDDEFDLEGYMSGWTAGGFEVLAEERGRTMLTTGRFERRPAHRVINIGLRGGAARPSTGYAFARIDREAREIADSLPVLGEDERPAPRARDQFLDAVLLTLMREAPERSPQVFVTLFATARTDRVLRLLDERATWMDIFAIIWVLPWWIFLRAWWIYVRARLVAI